MSYLLIMIIKYLQHCWTIFLRHVCQCGFFWSHHKELRMYGAITNSAVYVTVTVTFSCWLAHMAVTRNFHVGLTYVHLRNCALVLFHFFSQLIFSFWFFSFSLSPVGVPLIGTLGMEVGCILHTCTCPIHGHFILVKIWYRGAVLKIK